MPLPRCNDGPAKAVLTEQHRKGKSPTAPSHERQFPCHWVVRCVGRVQPQRHRERPSPGELTGHREPNLVQRRVMVDIHAELPEQTIVSNRDRRTRVDHPDKPRGPRRSHERHSRTNDRRAIRMRRLLQIHMRKDPARQGIHPDDQPRPTNIGVSASGNRCNTRSGRRPSHSTRASSSSSSAASATTSPSADKATQRPRNRSSDRASKRVRLGVTHSEV